MRADCESSRAKSLHGGRAAVLSRVRPRSMDGIANSLSLCFDCYRYPQYTVLGILGFITAIDPFYARLEPSLPIPCRPETSPVPAPLAAHQFNKTLISPYRSFSQRWSRISHLCLIHHIGNHAQNLIGSTHNAPLRPRFLPSQNVRSCPRVYSARIRLCFQR